MNEEPRMKLSRPGAVLLGSPADTGFLREHGGTATGRDLPRRNGVLQAPRHDARRLAGAGPRPGRSLVGSTGPVRSDAGRGRLRAVQPAPPVRQRRAAGGGQRHGRSAADVRAQAALRRRPGAQPLQRPRLGRAGGQRHEPLGAAGGSLRQADQERPRATAGTGRGAAGNRNLRLRALATGLFGALLHRASREPAQGRLPVLLPELPRGHPAAQPGRRGAVHHQWHPDHVRFGQQPARRLSGAGGQRRRPAAPEPAGRRHGGGDRRLRRGAQGALPPLAVDGCNGYWHGQPGMLRAEEAGLC